MISRRALSLRLLAVIFGVIVVTLLTFTYFAVYILERDIAPEHQKDVVVAGRTLQFKIERAIRLGIPFDQLKGVKSVLRPAQSTHAGVVYVAVTNLRGRILEAVGRHPGDQSDLIVATRIALGLAPPQKMEERPRGFRERLLAFLAPVISEAPREKPSRFRYENEGHVNTAFLIRDPDGKTVGVLHLGRAKDSISTHIGYTFVQVLVILIVVLLLVYEILFLVVETSYAGPLRIIVTALSRAASGDFRARVRYTAGRHLVRLADSYNDLFDRVNMAFARFSRAATEAGGSAGRRMQKVAGVLTNRYRFAGEGEAIELTTTRLVSVRCAVILFVMAEELARPFMPLYIKEIMDPGMALDEHLAVALPIAVFLVCAGIGVPVSTAWSRRVGRRIAFAVGTVVATSGLIGAALAEGYWDLVAVRALSGVGYAIAFGACEGYILDNTTKADRSEGRAHFNGALVVGIIAAPAIGGVLADRFGFSVTLLIGAGFGMIAAAAGWWLLSGGNPRQEEVGQPNRWMLIRVTRCFLSGRFVMLLLFCVIPGRVLLTGFIFLILPLFLAAEGASLTGTGRVMLLFGLVILLAGPVVAGTCRRFDAPGLLMGTGLMLCGGVLVPVVILESTTVFLTAIVLFAIGQAMLTSSRRPVLEQMIAGGILTDAPAAQQSMRMARRLGGAFGPILVAGFARFGDVKTALVLLGVFGVTTAVVFSFYFMVVGVVREEEADADAYIPPDAERSAAS